MLDKIQALIWDFGGVLQRTEDQTPRQDWEERLGLEPGELHDLVFKGKYGKLATLGRATNEDVWRSVGEQLGLGAGRLSMLRRDFWAGDQLDRELVAATRELRKSLKTALLSNAWPDLRPYITDELHIADAFDVIVISAEEGTAKPGSSIFQRILERLELPAHACVFIDDRLKNIQAANALGFQAIEFRRRSQALDELRNLLPGHLHASIEQEL